MKYDKSIVFLQPQCIVCEVTSGLNKIPKRDLGAGEIQSCAKHAADIPAADTQL